MLNYAIDLCCFDTSSFKQDERSTCLLLFLVALVIFVSQLIEFHKNWSEQGIWCREFTRTKVSGEALIYGQKRSKPGRSPHSHCHFTTNAIYFAFFHLLAIFAGVRHVSLNKMRMTTQLEGILITKKSLELKKHNNRREARCSLSFPVGNCAPELHFLIFLPASCNDGCWCAS